MTSSPGSHVARTPKNRNGFAPLATITRSGPIATPRVRDRSAAAASRSSGRPGAGQYPVSPARIAANAASDAWAGVAKSGSPISRWTTSRPARSSSRARARTANAPSVPRRSAAGATVGAAVEVIAPECRSAPRSARVLACVRRRLPEVVQLRRVAVVDLARDRPHLDRLVALVAMRARRPRRDPHRARRGHALDLVAEAHRQRPARDEVELLDLVVVVAGALLEVRVRRDADQRRGELLGAERSGQPAELARDVGAVVGVLDLVGIDDRVAAHGCHAYPRTRAGTPVGSGLVAKSDYTTLEVAGREVRLSNPDKVYFPRPGWTKLDIARYYVDLADSVLVHVRERPGTLKRFVNGIMEDPIWQKRVPKSIPDWLQTATVDFPSGRTAEELVANDAAHLVWAVNLGVIDFNPWPARRDDLDHPDELRIDLDPGPGIGWDDVRRTAMVVRDVLTEHGLRGYPKTSGSKGIHVLVRVLPSWDYLDVRRAALALAREVERRAPELATSKWWKEERHGVFVDYNQNARDRTVAACYSVRPTPDARVSCALDWDEVADVEPGDLRIDTVPARLRAHDPAADIDLEPGSLDHLLDLARRDEEGGLGDAPWPPHFPKQKDEPKRVQPSRDRDRPTQRGRAGDPQPGGPPPGVSLQHGFGSKPRTGQGHLEEFEE